MSQCVFLLHQNKLQLLLPDVLLKIVLLYPFYKKSSSYYTRRSTGRHEIEESVFRAFALGFRFIAFSDVGFIAMLRL